VEAVFELVNNPSAELGKTALLAVGGISRAARLTDPELANQIVDELHNLLDHLNGKLYIVSMPDFFKHLH